MRDCPKCGAAGEVTQTRQITAGTKRRRVCPSCGERWNTLEIPMPARASQAGIVQGLATRRGCRVPKAREDEWKFLKSKNLTNEEAAQAMGLRYRKAGL